MGKTVKIVPLSGACNRTKGCIEKYGEDGFEIVSFSPRSQRFGGTPALLVRETAGEKSRFNKWLGWLPLLEIGEENDTATT